MIFIAVSILFIAAALCFGLSSRVPTRRLGFVAAAASLAAAVAVAFPLTIGPSHLVTMDAAGVTLSLATTMAQPQAGVAIVALLAATGCLLSLALALLPTVKGFGAIFGWSLIGVAMVPLGLGVGFGSPVLVGIWSVAVIAAYIAYRASGALQRDDGFPVGISSGLFAGFLLLSGMFDSSGLAALAVLAAGMMLAGAAPFQATLHEATKVPAPLGALFYAIILPTLAFETLFAAPGAFGGDPFVKSVVLLALGSIGAVACAVGMLRERSLRALIGWASSMQASLLVAAFGLGAYEYEVVAWAVRGLLMNLALAGTLAAAAVTAFEQATGYDDYTQARPVGGLAGAGLLWLFAMASLVGLPPFWGFWPRYWLLTGAAAYSPWAVPLLIVSGLLALVAGLLPLAAFWAQRTAPASEPPAVRSRFLGGWLAAIILLLAGLFPQSLALLWNISTTSGVVATSPWLLGPIVAVVAALFGLLFRQGRWARTVASDADMPPTSLAAEQVASRLRFVVELARPQGLAQLFWRGLQWVSEQLQRIMNLFEQRYYLIGVLLTLVLIMFLMAQ
jgi:hypothetical protein